MSRSNWIRTGAPGLQGGQGDQGRRGVALRLLASEAAAHPRGLDDDHVARQPQDFRDDRLDLGGVLGRRGDEDVPVRRRASAHAAWVSR